MIPPDHSAGAVLALGDLAFESCILERVVFDLNGEPSLARLRAGPLRNRPALEDAVELETEVVVIVRGEMMLDDEHPFHTGAFGPLARRFPGYAEVALATILSETHG
jgi:hypothetical protein